MSSAAPWTSEGQTSRSGLGGMMTTSTTDTAGRGPALPGQTVVVIGGSSGIGLETARKARAEGAEVVLVGRDPGHLERAARRSWRIANGSLRRDRFGSPQAVLRRSADTY